MTLLIVGGVEGGQEEEYRALVNHFMKWYGENHLQLNLAKTKEIMMDFWKKVAPLPPVCISVSDIEIVRSYKYLGDKLEWSTNTGRASAGSTF